MLIVCAFYPGDQDQALRLAEWTLELGGGKSHDLLLINDARCQGQVADQVFSIFRRAFGSVERLSLADHYRSWPAAPNATFASAARHIASNRPECRYYLWTEPDAVPLKPEWLDDLEAEYRAALDNGKFFLGDLVNVPNVPVHCSGVAIYPSPLIQHAGLALMANPDIAWDVSASEQILPLFQQSKHLTHAWKHPPFADWEQVEREIFAFKPDACLFHADKLGSLYPLLRSRLFSTLPAPVVPAEPPRNGEASEVSGGIASGDGQSTLSGMVRDRTAQNATATVPETPFSCDILIKSYPGDYERLGYCLRSIEKFASGFRKVVIVIPSTAQEPAEANGPWKTPVEIKTAVESDDGYLFQQTIKASAHEWTDANYILHLDSDCLLTQPITPKSFLRDGKPVWYITPYAAIDAPWQPYMEKFFREPVEFETMRRFPFLVPRGLHKALAAFCQLTHGMSLTDYILSQPYREYSEFNALGSLAYSRAREDFHWIDTTKQELPPTVLLQEFSHGEFTADRKAEFEKILSEGSEVAERAEGNVGDDGRRIPVVLAGSNPAPPTLTNCPAPVLAPPTPEIFQSRITPWADKSETLHRLGIVARYLKTFCCSPAHTSQVRKELKRVGLLSPRARAIRRKR